MDKIICNRVEWQIKVEGKEGKGYTGVREFLVLKTHTCPPINLAILKGLKDGNFGGVILSDTEFYYTDPSSDKVKEKIEITIFGQRATFSKLQSLTRQQLLSVDMTPDDNLHIRILEAYRINCDCRFVSEPYSILVDLMNKDCDKRAKILDRALEILRMYSKGVE